MGAANIDPLPLIVPPPELEDPPDELVVVPPLEPAAAVVVLLLLEPQAPMATATSATITGIAKLRIEGKLKWS